MINRHPRDINKKILSRFSVQKISARQNGHQLSERFFRGWMSIF